MFHAFETARPGLLCSAHYSGTYENDVDVILMEIMRNGMDKVVFI